MKNIFILLTTFFMIFSCSPEMSAVWQKPDYQPKSFQKIAVIALSKDMGVRQNLEEKIIENLKKNDIGNSYVSGLDLIPPDSPEDDWSEEHLSKLMKENNVDAVICSSVVNNYKSSRYEDGDDVYYPQYYRAGNYIYRTYSVISQPGYYRETQNYVLETSIFDLTTNQDDGSSLVWRGQSEVRDPSSVSSGASSFAKNLVAYIDEEDVIKSN